MSKKQEADFNHIQPLLCQLAHETAVESLYINNLITKVQKFIQRNQIKDYPFMIGIAGPSASGKTFVSNHLATILNDFQDLSRMPFASILSLDHFYLDRSEQYKQTGELFFRHVNLDEPAALDMSLFQSKLEQLKAGCSVYYPRYNIQDNSSQPDAHFQPATPIIIFEGLFTLLAESFSMTQQPIHQLFDLTIFIDAPAQLITQRWWSRAALRNCKNNDAGQALFQRVNEMYHQHIAPTKGHADLHLLGNADHHALTQTLTRLAEALRQVVLSKDNIKKNFLDHL